MIFFFGGGGITLLFVIDLGFFEFFAFSIFWAFFGGFSIIYSTIICKKIVLLFFSEGGLKNFGCAVILWHNCFYGVFLLVFLPFAYYRSAINNVSRIYSHDSYFNSNFNINIESVAAIPCLFFYFISIGTPMASGLWVERERSQAQ